MAEVTVLPHSAAGDGGVLSAIGHEFDAHSFTYTSRDVILYALGGERSCDPIIRLSWWNSYV